jgi:hypothetical protein
MINQRGVYKANSSFSIKFLYMEDLVIVPMTIYALKTHDKNTNIEIMF